MNTHIIRIYRFQPYLGVAVLEEVGVEKKKDPNNCVFSVEVFGGHKKVPIQWLQGDFCIPLEPLFLVYPRFKWVPSKAFPPLMGTYPIPEEHNYQK